MTALRRKQGISDQAAWAAAMTRSRDEWPDSRLDRLIVETTSEIKQLTHGRRVAFAWSGGKDSLALAHVARLVGIQRCVLAISNLEYPEFLRWVTDHMPPGLTVVSTGQNLPWLRAHTEMLFPVGPYGPRWFTIVNHRGQEKYFRDQKLDVLLLGRRRIDGNYCGPAGCNIYTNQRGITRYSPLASWPHEAVFSLLVRENINLPPCYSWPRGYQVGTGSWPARQWTRSQDHGFEEVWSIDPDVVRSAALELPAATDWLTRTGRS